MQTKSFLLTALGLALTGSAAIAQMPNASQQVESVQQRRQIEQSLPAGTNAVPELYSGETSDVGPQSVLRVKSRRTYIEAYADAQYFYSDNMFLSDHHKQGSDVLVSTVQAALAPTPYEVEGGLLAPRVGYQHQWFCYGLASSGTVDTANASGPFPTFGQADLDSFDFNVSTVFGDVAWIRNNWTVSLGTDFRRLLDSNEYNEFYREYVPRWSVRRDFPICETLALAVAYVGDYRVTKTATPVPPGYGDTFNDRADNSLVLSGSYRLCQHAYLQPYYQFQFTHYTRIDRNDALNSFGLAIYCPITRQITLRTFVSYDNMSTDGFYAQNYNQFSAGGGLNLDVRF
ncbi:MAG TPA: hypothetical protein VFF11_15205 [Candidatus Binatia bacterium]|nr:hypothetical protein [Candidatus Binatia bacterium]